MQAVGIIAEYNPFHNGHKWHADKAREISGCSFVIAVMSGNFVQRGEPAIFDKWQRAEMAIKSGIDLVIELPVVYAVRSAQYFAAGGIRLLNSLGIVSHVCFGAEHDDLKTLSEIAQITDSRQIQQTLHDNLKTGSTYAAALGKALQQQCDISNDLITSPNNILAIEYLRAIKNLAPSLMPLPVKRQHAGYHDTGITAPFASATAIRQALLEKLQIDDEMSTVIPPASQKVIAEALRIWRGPVNLQAFSNIVLAKIRTANIQYLEELPDVSEGLQYKISDSALNATNIDELLSMIKSKRYTRTRLQRIIIHALFGLTKSQLVTFDKCGPLYARVLAFNQKGRTILKYISQSAAIPIITKTTRFLNSKQRSGNDLTPLQTMLAYDTLASDIYVLGMPASHWSSGGWDFRHSPVYINS